MNSSTKQMSWLIFITISILGVEVNDKATCIWACSGFDEQV
jgi:hypothetical protein